MRTYLSRLARRGYIQLMRLRGKHVLAADCWCHPHVESFRPGGDFVAGDK